MPGKALEVHPDKDKLRGCEDFQRLASAYETLSNPQSRPGRYQDLRTDGFWTPQITSKSYIIDHCRHPERKVLAQQIRFWGVFALSSILRQSSEIGGCEFGRHMRLVVMFQRVNRGEMDGAATDAAVKCPSSETFPPGAKPTGHHGSPTLRYRPRSPSPDRAPIGSARPWHRAVWMSFHGSNEPLWISTTVWS